MTGTNPVTSTTGRVKPSAAPLVHYDARKIDSLESQIKDLKGLVQSLVTKQAVAPAQNLAQNSAQNSMVAAGMLAGNSSLPWGLAAFAGLILGAIFMYVRTAIGRKSDREE